MATAKQYRSGLIASIHETAEGLHSAGVMTRKTLREFDELCLAPARPLAPEQIRHPWSRKKDLPTSRE